MASQKPEPYYKIQNGPGKFSLITLFDDGEQRAVTFMIDINGVPGGKLKELPVLLSSIEREDGSGESWNIKARTSWGGNGGHVDIYYNTRRREGTLRFKRARFDGRTTVYEAVGIAEYLR